MTLGETIEKVTPSQVASWYHSKILRIPHGEQRPTKRYLDDEQILELFDGTVAVQEKVDGKMAWEVEGSSLLIYEDMTGKHTVHNHIMKYKDLPADKRIVIDMISANVITDFFNARSVFKVLPVCPQNLTYAFLTLHNPTIFYINQILRVLSNSPSHFGSDVIEGLVIKNYDKQLFGKWINYEFEDKL